MSDQVPGQLTLGVKLDDDATFENFIVAPRNVQAVSCLSDPGPQQRLLTIWGARGCGLTHLLQAACHQRETRHSSALYLPMRDKSHLSPEILQGTNMLSLVCIDDLQLLAGDSEWEAALFTAFNAMGDSGTQLILAADAAPSALSVQLPDLRSRLQSSLVFQIAELTDAEKLLALQLRARNRGMDLSDGVADYILLRAQRDLGALMRILEQLDESSLTQQRRLTIPLVKSTLGW